MNARACIFMMVMFIAAAGCFGADGAPPSISGDEAARRMAVPKGFKVTCFAAEPDVRQPVGFAIDDRGRLWVAEAYNYPKWQAAGNDRIIILEDSDGDGKADKRTVFYDKLNYVTGIEVGFGGVWVTSPPSFYFIPDKDGDDKPDGEPVALLDGFGYQQSAHNIVTGATWGPDGWLYGGHGGTSYSEMGKPGTAKADRIKFDGGVWRYHPTKHIFEPFCEGFTNPWGVDFDDHGQAFISNCVLPHLYHVIQGGHYDRRRESTIYKHVYQRIGPAADHLHYAGDDWAKSRGAGPEQLALGGGHAHAGCMIYLADTFPPQYRGNVFMMNIHGSRVNMDTFKRNGSGFAASHGPDFALANDSWFRGVTIQSDHNGDVYVSDWHDTGECHSMKPDRTNGRIFKITHERSPKMTTEIEKASDEELVALQQHSNDWWVRHARRLLQERAAAKPRPAVHAALMRQLSGVDDSPASDGKGERAQARKLRGLWALHATGGLTADLLAKQFGSNDEYIRAWAVQLSAEERDVSPQLLSTFVRLAKEDASPVVRLYLAAACQRLPAADRWDILAGLAARAEDVADPNLPLMIWYGLEPCVAVDGPRALKLAAGAKMPVLRQFVARRIASAPAAVKPEVAKPAAVKLVVVKPVEQGALPHRVHVFEDYETQIEKRWWLRGEAVTDAKALAPSLSTIANTRCAKAVESKDFDDKQGDKDATYKAVVFNPVPGPPMGKNTRLSFRCRLKGTGTLRVQIYSLSNGYHRCMVLQNLKQDEWQALTVDMTKARRPDGTGGPLSADERIDDIQFYIDKDADLWVDDILLYEEAEEDENRLFPRRVIFTGWFDTGKQGAGHEWPGTFEIAAHEKPRTWKHAKSVPDDAGRPGITINLRGERPLGDTNRLYFRYKLTGSDSILLTFANPATGASSIQTLRGLKKDEWSETEITFKGRHARTGAAISVSEIRLQPIGAAVKDAVLLVDDVLLTEP